MVNISIIMPLYNAEIYLKETLISVLKQTYQKFELICINDASTDNTIKILYQFQNTDNRIRIIENKERMGAAISRNIGIYAAEGKYITFLDGDDIFDEIMLESAYKEAEKNDVDVVMYDYKHVLSDCIYEKKIMYRSELFIEKYCKIPFSITDFEPIEYMYWSTSPCNKLYKKSFILSNKLEFQTLSSSNDVYFVSMALLLAPKIIMLEDRRVMLYARDHDTLTRISYDRDPMCTYLAMKKVWEELAKRELCERLGDYYYCALFYYLRLAILKSKSIEKAKYFYSFLQKNGIDDIDRIYGEKHNDKIIEKLINNFKQLDFESNWYDIENILNYYLYKNGEKIFSIFQSYMNQNKQIAIWGVGENGKSLLRFLYIHNLKNVEVIDIDKNKQGNLVDGFVIRNPEDILQKIHVVIASSYDIYREIVVECTNLAIDVFTIGEIVGMA